MAQYVFYGKTLHSLRWQPETNECESATDSVKMRVRILTNCKNRIKTLSKQEEGTERLRDKKTKRQKDKESKRQREVERKGQRDGEWKRRRAKDERRKGRSFETLMFMKPNRKTNQPLRLIYRPYLIDPTLTFRVTTQVVCCQKKPVWLGAKYAWNDAVCARRIVSLAYKQTT